MNAPTPALVARPERLRLVGQRRQILAVMHQRLMFGMLVYAGIIAIIALRLVYLAAFGDHAGRKGGALDLTPERGDIVDRDGQALARTIDAWTIGLQPAKVIGNKLDLARKLAELMPEKDEAAYLQMLRSGRNFYYLRRRAPPGLVAAINSLGEPGLALEREPDRLYPQTSLAAHVIGYTDIDGKGNAGIERAFDQQLLDPERRGEPITLSISSKVQQALEHELGGAMSHFSAIGAAGVIMDIHTGEVLAMTSLPQLNPNAAGQGTPEARFNRATLGVYELGSTFKPFTVAMAMDAGIVKSMGQMYSCPRQLHVAGRTINDTHPYGRACSVAEIMKESSNIGTAQIADQLGAKRQREFLKQMGFLDKVEVELLERGRTLSPGANWNQIETMTVGYGHGIAVTPLHLASGYATLFNGGIYRPATLLKVDRNHPAGKGRRVFSEDTSYKMRSLLRLVVTDGTGKKADAPGYRVGGKTGTAEKYHNRSLKVTSFAGVFPMDEPRFVMVMMLDEPKATAETFGFSTAGWNIAPAFGRTVARIAPMLGVRPDKRREPNMAEVLPYVQKEKGH
ncbi:peptidoglycan D,D-transpeptidase FtsI family protein [Sphingomonas edaphi]|jgi:cell division protein FtsI (penicillin-binding protein 3)|uniref:Penicillin-binding protein 2 n=1 Tax=Sphingomonas edaphi TaxID=2315689 RepID=A0A418Q256_9SPHN|nr:penicillin-binding protein 2 [Sphingomonas edaphi]RIX32112.1 penicillin-binding protein 2 [Sphingomonas edaphi]